MFLDIFGTGDRFTYSDLPNKLFSDSDRYLYYDIYNIITIIQLLSIRKLGVGTDTPTSGLNLSRGEKRERRFFFIYLVSKNHGGVYPH